MILRVHITELFAGEERPDLTGVNLSRLVLVEHFERSAKILLLKESLGTHSGRQKFSVVDCSVTIGVSRPENLHQLLTILALTQSSLEFIERDAAVSILVQFLEDALEFAKFGRVTLNRDRHQGNLFQFLRMLKLLHRVDVQLLKQFSILLLRGVQLDPLVLKGLLGSQTALRLGDKLLDEVLSLGGDAVPLLAIEVELALANHVQNLLIIVTVKRRVTAKKNV